MIRFIPKGNSQNDFGVEISRTNKSIPKKLILFCTTFCFFLLMLIWVFISNEQSETSEIMSNRSLNQETWTLSQKDGYYTSYQDVSNIYSFAFVCQNASVSILDDSGVPIYKYDYDISHCRLPEITWHIVNIPKDIDHISINIQSNETIDIINIYTGYSSDIASYILRTELLDILFSAAIFVLGVILCIFHLIHTTTATTKRPTLFLGLFCIAFFFLHISNMHIGQLMVRNTTILYFLFYIAIYLIPVFLCLHITDLTGISCSGLVCAHFIIASIILGMQFVSTFWNINVPLSTVSIVIYSWFIFIAVGYFLCRAIFILLDNNDYMTIVALVLLFVAIFSIIMSFSGVQYSVASFTTDISLLCSIFIIVLNEIRIFSATINESHNIEMYKTIALRDPLTGLGNRFAFMNTVSKLPLQNLCIVSFDINNLKYHNDTYGHQVGDKLLCDAAKVLAGVYGRNNVFRFGGDEFEAYIVSSSPEEQEQLRNKLNDICNKFNAKSDKVKISIAAGYAFGNKKDTMVDTIIEKADKAMYVNKAFLKSRTHESEGLVCE